MKMIFCSIASFLLSFVSASTQTPGKIDFPPDAIISNNASPEDTNSLIKAVCDSWHNYLHLDQAHFINGLTLDVIRFSQRFGKIQYGRTAVANDLKNEWEYFEKPGGVIAESLTVSNAEFFVQGEGDNKTACVIYQLDVTGGARWKYDDEALVFELLVQSDGKWAVAYYADSWGLDIGGKEPFEFDFVYPISNLSRATQFYSSLLGDPQTDQNGRALFSFAGGRFILDGNPAFASFVQVRADLPNGYAIFYVDDVVQERDRLRDSGVSFIDGTDHSVHMEGSDPQVIGLDPEGNVFVLQQKIYEATQQSQPPVLEELASSISPADEPYHQAALEMAKNWLQTDSKRLLSYCDEKVHWYDDTRYKIFGFTKGHDALASALPKYWSRYDRNSSGLIAKMTISNMKIRHDSDHTIVSYQRSLQGTGSHPYQDLALVTQIFITPQKNTQTMVLSANQSHAPVIDLDYTGYPETHLSSVESFYRKTMRLGAPYRDDDWRGFWGQGAVFGIFTADVEEDGIPQWQFSNGYISFWIRSAEKIYDYLEKQNVDFPVIPAINSQAGINVYPGYKEVVSTDSEGNVVVFTEYTGHRND